MPTDEKQVKETLNRLDRAVAIIQNDLSYIKDSIDKLEKTMKLNYVTRVEFEGHNKRISDQENNMAWLTRLVIGAVVTAVLAFVLRSNLGF